MSRHWFGQSPADWTFTVGDADAATLAGGIVLTLWDSPVSGTQITDLLDSTGSPITTVTSSDGSSLPIGTIPRFLGPDGGITTLWADAGGGSRSLLVATDMGADVATLQTGTAGHYAAVNPHGTRLQDLTDVYDPNITDYLAATPFTAAHRGSGGEFPEHTLRSYVGALAAGAPAIEVSVQLTSDGVLVCMHDTTLDRTTDHTGNLNAWTYAALREKVKVTQQSLLGAGWGNQDIPTLQEVMNALYGKCIIFLEAKSNDAIVPLQNFLLKKYPGCQRSVIWKNYYQSTSFAWAKTNGFTVWGYVDAATASGSMDTYDANIDFWGVPIASTDAQVSMVVARGKPAMVWDVHRHIDVERLTGLGVVGLMEAQWIYLNNLPALTSDLFTAQISQPGTLGIARYDPTYALKYDGAGGAYVPVVPNDAVMMGGHRPGSATAHTINFSMKWDTAPASTLHADVAFCRVKDDPWQFANTNNSYGALASPGGYHALVRGNGDIQLYFHVAGSTTGTQLGTLPTVAPVNGAYMTFQIIVSATQIVFKRTDVGPYTLTVTHSTYRGRYWHIGNGSITSLTNKPTFKLISVA
jgi:hypothetical protein